jgi:phosphatidylinositol glycan class P protein
MLLVYIYVALLAYNVEYLTLPLESVECIVDDAANIAVLDSKGRVRKGGSKRSAGRFGKPAAAAAAATAAQPGIASPGMSRSKADKMNWRQMWNEGTDAVMDIPIGGVCEVLYRDPRPG